MLSMAYRAELNASVKEVRTSLVVQWLRLPAPGGPWWLGG